MAAWATFIIILLCNGLGNGAKIDPPLPIYDTIVIGLGSAGTMAASTLAHAGKRVLALEAQGRIGGRVRTEKFGDGIVEVGAEWIHGQLSSRVYELGVQNNVTIIPQDLDFEVYRSDRSREDVQLLRELLEYSMDAAPNKSDKPESMGQMITRKLTEYLQKKKPELLMNVEFMKNIMEFVNHAVDNNVASNDWGDVSAVSDYQDLEGHQAMSWHRYGYKTFFEILLNTYNNSPGLPSLEVKLNKEVTNIEWSKNSSGDVVITCQDGDRYTAHDVIITASVGVLKEKHSTLFSPPLPQEKATAIDIIPMGLIDKIILSFDDVSFMPHTSIEFFWTMESKKSLPVEDKWMANITGLSGPTGSNNTLTLWTFGDTAKLIETLPEEVVKSKVVELLQMFLGANVTVPQPNTMWRTTWFSNPFARGSYSYDNMEMVSHPGVRRTLGAPLLDGLGTPRVLFAGEATDELHFATVHGASDSGYREASRLLSGFRSTTL